MEPAADLQPSVERRRVPVLDPHARDAIETESRNLLLSLSTMCALLARDAVPGPRDRSLALFLGAQVTQLEVLVGEFFAASKLADGRCRSGTFDLGQMLTTAALRLRAPMNLRVSQAIEVCGDQELAAQVIQSALALAVRSADGRVTAIAGRSPDGGEISIEIPVDDQLTASVAEEKRLVLLGKMHAEQGGSLRVERRTDGFTLRLLFAGPTG